MIVESSRVDQKSTAKFASGTMLFVYRDFVTSGELAIGGKNFTAVLSDASARGDFRSTDGKNLGVSLHVDLNGDKKFDTKAERFDVQQPFNIGGTTYAIKDMAADGTSFQIVKSTETVAEKKVPPSLGVGEKTSLLEKALR